MDIRILEIHSLDEAARVIESVGADPYAVPLMAPKALLRTLVLQGVDNRAANLIKQEMLALGGEAAVNRSVSSFCRGTSNVFIMGTERQCCHLLKKLATQPFGLKSWKAKLETALSHYRQHSYEIHCGKKRLKLGPRPLVMGIVNVTPDSFSDGGKYNDTDRAAVQAGLLAEQGAQIIDIGGESTRPGAKPVPAAEEINRVVPVIKRIVKTCRVPVSIDTYKPAVARAALDAGASLVNDITGLRYENGDMARVVSRFKVPVVLMHMQGMPRTMQKAPRYNDVVADIFDFFSERIAFALQHGINEEQIILDPGIGFGKTVDHNVELLRRISEFKALGRPLLIGTSRKYFIGAVTGAQPANERLAGSLASVLWSALQGVQVVRVHDVRETVQALSLFTTIRGV